MVELIKVFGNEKDIACAASKAFGNVTEDYDVERIITKLLRSKHLLPFEFARMWFDVETSISCHRQMKSYRSCLSICTSSRYKPLGEPDLSGIPQEYHQKVSDFFQQAKLLYDDLRTVVKREEARKVLPIGFKCTYNYNISVRHLLHFFEERLAKSAEREIRLVASQMFDLFLMNFPITAKLFQASNSHLF